MVYVPPYNPKQYKRANRHLASGRLRRLKEVLLTNRRLSLVVKTTSRRPRGRSDWRPYYGAHLYRSGYQKRRRDALFAEVRALWQSQWKAEKRRAIHRC